MGNPFVHLDLTSADRAASKKFYKAVFDWKFNDMPAMNWTGIDIGKLPPGVQGCGGGIGDKMMPDQPTGWVAYVGVASVKKAIEKAQKAGATVVLPYQSLGDMGAIGVFIDPQGSALGVYEPGKPAKKPDAKKPAAK